MRCGRDRAHLQTLFTVISGVDKLVRRSEGNVRVVVYHDRSDVCLGIPGGGSFGELEAVEKHPPIHLLHGLGREHEEKLLQHGVHDKSTGTSQHLDAAPCIRY